ncbi:3-hydroxy-3-methylglutaryl-CoA reductase [Desulfurococcus amylolyticus]|uniref:3-hydroxy-3-methylglutaryl-coenzyme A reductase n=1 Tax=Desulfurococcus amylolyticus DSM 16532 TaxID=768672 RepID=I3XQQ4_DESAM|nr:3-hydroxy-3-methylglutaryl-CoA reductase [Desulfurococcus amylolyticus]AFL66278.1 3-hydroxy-3-methylglutaryl-coenzyme A reductase [Desulfurococcus amylolyticus DSM 16532]
MESNIDFLLESLRKSGKPFEYINELKLSENLRALLRRLYIQSKEGISLSAIGSTILDFAEGDYEGFNVIGALQIPIGVIGVLNLFINNERNEIYVVTPFIKGRLLNRLGDGIRILEGSIVNIGIKDYEGVCSSDAYVTFSDHKDALDPLVFPKLYNDPVFLSVKHSYMALIYYMLGLDAFSAGIPVVPSEYTINGDTLRYKVIHDTPYQLLNNMVTSEIRELLKAVEKPYICAILLLYSLIFDLGHASLTAKT